MARLIPVTDPADPRLADYTRLRDVNLRKSLEAEHGLFMAEGEKVIRRAVATGHPVRSLLTARRWVESLSDVVGDAPVYVADDDVVEAVTGFAVHRGALASMERLPLPSVAAVLAGDAPAGRAFARDDVDDRPAEAVAGYDGDGERGRHSPPRRILVLEDLVDHGNVGAIFRCAAALGIDAVVLSPRCADPLYRRSVKVSMGAVFAIPYARMTDWHGGLAELRAAGFTLLALTPDQSAVPLRKVPMGERAALLLGTEGDGLSSRWLSEADHPVCIPMSSGAMELGVDSLNVVAATAIACHELMHG
ncbi:RNA methyltransferase [Actinoallomurus purpureus]|uniref:TrmH family RNA methyltransferase n=1 Tax=Actinoallomurus purpureus TaxID=478114 RepID=UPI002093A4FE|nr:RNA methyltransferase [Actinoallomurus purpureus]MCO6007047.1 RNA methyltransferase [Actinoallomurus purpureus]